jgi:hypothetical protein
MERPVGPPNDHVLTVEQAQSVVTGMGLDTVAVQQPGELLPYHYTVLAARA